MATQRFILRSDMWTLVGITPCFVQAQGGGVAKLYIGTIKPDLTAPALELPTGYDKSLNITLAGQTIWAKVDDMTLEATSVVVAS